MNLAYLKENSLMRRATLISAVLLAFGSTLLAALPARAAEYGAIAWDKQTGKRGWSWNQPTQKRAEEAAVSECGGSGCKVIIRAGPGDVRRTGVDGRRQVHRGCLAQGPRRRAGRLS